MADLDPAHQGEAATVTRRHPLTKPGGINAPSEGPGTDTGHGHVWRRPDRMVARCGGPKMCARCAADREAWRPDRITPEIAAQVLHHFGEGGYPAGSFIAELIHLIAHADPFNKRRLANGFGGYVAAVDLAQNDLRGVAELTAIAADATDRPHPKEAKPDA